MKRNKEVGTLVAFSEIFFPCHSGILSTTDVVQSYYFTLLQYCVYVMARSAAARYTE